MVDWLLTALEEGTRFDPQSGDAVSAFLFSPGLISSVPGGWNSKVLYNTIPGCSPASLPREAKNKKYIPHAYGFIYINKNITSNTIFEKEVICFNIGFDLKMMRCYRFFKSGSERMTRHM